MGNKNKKYYYDGKAFVPSSPRMRANMSQLFSPLFYTPSTYIYPNISSPYIS